MVCAAKAVDGRFHCSCGTNVSCTIEAPIRQLALCLERHFSPLCSKAFELPQKLSHTFRVGSIAITLRKRRPKGFKGVQHKGPECGGGKVWEARKGHSAPCDKPPTVFAHCLEASFLVFAFLRGKKSTSAVISLTCIQIDFFCIIGPQKNTAGPPALNT